MWGQPQQRSWVFDSQVQVEAVHRLCYLIEEGEPFAVLEGAHGTGKTTLLQHLRGLLTRQRYGTALISVAALDESAVLWHLAAALSISVRDQASCSELLRQVRDELAGRAACGHRTVFLLDDIDLASADVSAVLQALIATARTAGHQLAVVAATEQPLPPALDRLCSLPVRLGGFEAEESVQFLRQALSRDGADLSQINDAAINTAALAAEGSPARLVRIGDMLTAVQRAHPELTISSDVVEAAARELLPRRAG